MLSRILKLATSLTVLSAITACTSDAPDPVGVQTIRMEVIANADNGGRPFSVHMTQEHTTINTPNPPYFGDPDGSGEAVLTVNHGQGTICWELSVTGIAPATAAHIHRGATLVRGPVVIPITTPDANGHSSGCSEFGRELLREILTDPEGFYVNVHTAEFPPGAVRSQLR